MAYKRVSPQPVVEGGTGVQSNTAYAVLCGGTAAANPIQSIVSVGTAGQVLTSNGAAALPTFQTGGGGGAVPAASDSFFAYLSANQTVNAGSFSTTTIVFDLTTFNNGANYNTGTHLFTAPANGTYFFGTFVSASASSTTSGDGVIIMVNGVEYCGGASYFNGAPISTHNITTLIQLSLGDTVNVGYANNGSIGSATISFGMPYSPGALGFGTYFFGYRLF